MSHRYVYLYCFIFFFFNDTATTEIYTLSLHDALPIYVVDGPAHGAQNEEHAQPERVGLPASQRRHGQAEGRTGGGDAVPGQDRKSTRLNSSHANISYAVFCLKKKKKQKTTAY